MKARSAVRLSSPEKSAARSLELSLVDRKHSFWGNLDAKRDWGHAREYVEGMWRILQQAEPDDYVLATGETHSVREFVEKAFAQIDLPIAWEGVGVKAKGLDASKT